MIDPLSPLFQMHDAMAGDIMPNAADPASAQAVMIVGMITIAVTALWAVGGLGAAVWLRLNKNRDRRFHSTVRTSGNPNAR